MATDGFRTTRWTWVEAAGGADAERAREALAELCQAYWVPLYAFVRRSGLKPEEAEDAVQGFFARLIERRDLARVRREKGRFRSFLRVAIRNYVATERGRERAVKRGGGRLRLPLDGEEAERRLEGLDSSEETPEQAFDRAWACELLAGCLEALREEYRGRGKEELFEALAPFLQAGERPPSGEDLARRLGMSPVAVRVAVHRLRERFRRRLVAEVERTVRSRDEVAEEIEALSRCFER